ncbi:hypothetical protein H8356DRAFT_1363016 [Neocallimastix lanati (nom. inval.)]|nr:hypothetical protein H8356DRAFT_1363016 [Neocallimastix sp. JGI-2020a]
MVFMIVPDHPYIKIQRRRVGVTLARPPPERKVKYSKIKLERKLKSTARITNLVNQVIENQKIRDTVYELTRQFYHKRSIEYIGDYYDYLIDDREQTAMVARELMGLEKLLTKVKSLSPTLVITVSVRFLQGLTTKRDKKARTSLVFRRKFFQENNTVRIVKCY